MSDVTRKLETALNVIAEADPDVNNRLGRTGRDRDFLYEAVGRRAFGGEATGMQWIPKSRAMTMIGGVGRAARKARYTSPLIKCRFPATEFLPSWNIRLPRLQQAFSIYLRVADKSGKTSPWFFLGEGGNSDHSAAVKTDARGWGKTHIDYLALKKPVTAFQYRVDFQVDTAPASIDEAPQLHRFYVHYSGQGTSQRVKPEVSGTGKVRRVKVPYRSQLDVDVKKLRNIICCPTCVAMVLESYGRDHPTLTVCESAYDKRHKMYGIWPRASQAAFEFGCKARVDRFRNMGDVRAYLESGRPVIASIRVGEGELRGARYPRSNGHLIVITGLKKNKVLVNDPFSAGPRGSEIEYEIEDIEKVWLDRGGVAILIENNN